MLSLRFRGRIEICIPAYLTPHNDQPLTNIEQSDAVELPPGIEFRDPAASALTLARVQRRIDSAVYQSVLHILAESPDPDTVVVLLDRLLDGATGELASRLGNDSSLLHYACLIFGHSAWLGEALIQNIDLLRRMGRRAELDRSLSREEFREEFARMHAGALRADLALSLARFRKREYVRILLRDLLGIATLAETTEEISSLADALIEEALQTENARLQRRYGCPRSVDADGRWRDSRFAVVSLGKLGGNELNYSSDVDLMFLYDGGLQPPTATISNHEYFIRLAQQTTELLSRRTGEGQVFRIDLRLRPLGHEGELAVALPRAIQYYSQVALDWELQAMIKARHSAGDLSLTREFVRAVAPYVYRANVNFAAVKTALQSREKIDRRGRGPMPGRSPERAINVKLDRGGIRDIEFLVQCLQRVYGGDEAWLRSRGTLGALQKLHDKEHISGKDFHYLTKAYEFLRNLEHRLQLRHGRQSHQLPTGDSDLTVLAKCLNRQVSPAASSEQFVLGVKSRMAAVAEIYRRIVYQEQSHQFVDPEGNLQLQAQVPASAENSYSQIMQRLAIDAPQLLKNISRSDLSQHARRNLDRFLNSAATSSERYGAVLRSPQAVEDALTIFECSEHLTDILVRCPADVELLTEVREEPELKRSELLVAPDQAPDNRPDPVLAYLANCGMERLDALALFRQQFRRALFMANARDLFRRRSVWEILKENSKAADNALRYAVALADAPAGFAVMALGRLGSQEFDLLSDADVLFVADESTNREEARGAAERMMESLTAYTRDGTVFPVDARLRPQGREGELVTTPGQLSNYFSREAKPWEAITYLRLRFVCGSYVVGEEGLAVVRDGIAKVAGRPEFASELGEMRLRLEASDQSPNLKTGAGGTYDIDFLVGRVQAEHDIWGNGTLAERIAVLLQHGCIEVEDARILAESVEFLRTLEHYIRLVTGRPGKVLPSADHAQATVAKLMAGASGYVEGLSLGDALTATMRRTRETCLKYPF